MKNISVILSKQYVKRFYEFLSLSVDKKELSTLKKKVEKYEDVSYIKSMLNDNIRSSIIENYNSHKEEYINECNTLKEELNNYYNTHFLNKEIIDVPTIKKELEELSNKLEAINYNLYLNDINQLYEFKNNINVELGVYVDKHKSEEYMDMSVFHVSITNIINEVKQTLDSLISDYQKEDEEYYNLYLERVYREYNNIFNSSSSKTKSMPTWAKGLIFCAPWIIGFCVFTLYPLIQTLIFSFSTVNLSPAGFETTPIGFTNYINLFSGDTSAWGEFKNYIVKMVVYVPVITIISLILALLLNTKIKAKGFFRVLFFFPVIITSGPVLSILIEQGVTSMPGLNTLVDINSLTASMPDFVKIAFNILTGEFVMILWFCGIQTLVFITSLQKIDKGVYEASAIDGASKWEQFWKVTLPAINPTIVINVVFTLVMQSIFALNPIIIKIREYMNDSSTGKGYGYSSALAFTYFLIMIILLVIFVLIFKKHEKRVKEVR